MKLIIRLIGLVSIFGFNIAYAQNQTFELDELASYVTPVYSRLDLYSVSKVKIVTEKSSDLSNKEILRAEIHFPNANKLVATGFKRIDNKYRAVVNNAWVFRQVIVDIIPEPYLESYTNANIEIYVAESGNYLNSSSNELGERMFAAWGILKDKTPNSLADTTSVIHQGKRAYIKLYQRESSNEAGDQHGHPVKINHLGNGEFTRYIPINRNATAVAFLTTETEGVTFYSIRHKDEFGHLIETPPEPIEQLFNAF